MNILSEITKYTIIVIAIVQVSGALILAESKADIVWQILMGSVMLAIVISSSLLLSLLSSKPFVSLPTHYLVLSLAETLLVLFYMFALFKM